MADRCEFVDFDWCVARSVLKWEHLVMEKSYNVLSLAVHLRGSWKAGVVVLII